MLLLVLSSSVYCQNIFAFDKKEIPVCEYLAESIYRKSLSSYNNPTPYKDATSLIKSMRSEIPVMYSCKTKNLVSKNHKYCFVPNFYFNAYTMDENENLLEYFDRDNSTAIENNNKITTYGGSYAQLITSLGFSKQVIVPYQFTFNHTQLKFKLSIRNAHDVFFETNSNEKGYCEKLNAKPILDKAFKALSK